MITFERLSGLQNLDSVEFLSDAGKNLNRLEIAETSEEHGLLRFMLGSVNLYYSGGAPITLKQDLIRFAHGLFTEARSFIDPKYIEFAEINFGLGETLLKIAKISGVPRVAKKASDLMLEAEIHPIITTLRFISPTWFPIEDRLEDAKLTVIALNKLSRKPDFKLAKRLMEPSFNKEEFRFWFNQNLKGKKA